MNWQTWHSKLKKISDDAAKEEEANRERRHLRAGELMALFKEWDGLSYKIITPYQYRIFKGAYYIDYYPTSRSMNLQKTLPVYVRH